MRKSSQKKYVFCLEGLWENDLRDRSTVRPILDLLKLQRDVDYIYKDCATTQELECYLSKLGQKRYDAYSILYFATHGDKFMLKLGHDNYTLDQLELMLEGKCKNRIVIFASCSTVNIDKRHLKDFLAKTGALAVCGYKSDVDWLTSTAFELLLLGTLQEGEYSKRGLVKIESEVDTVVKRFRDLKFRMVTAKEL